MEKMETDIIVVAAGLSGLAAAISAAENGAGVLVFEKSGTTGGAANMGMGPLGVGSRIQRVHMISLTPGEAFRKHMYFTHYRVDARMVRDYYFKSGDTIDWLMDMGVEFAGCREPSVRRRIQGLIRTANLHGMCVSLRAEESPDPGRPRP